MKRDAIIKVWRGEVFIFELVGNFRDRLNICGALLSRAGCGVEGSLLVVSIDS